MTGIYLLIDSNNAVTVDLLSSPPAAPVLWFNLGVDLCPRTVEALLARIRPMVDNLLAESLIINNTRYLSPQALHYRDEILKLCK